MSAGTTVLTRELVEIDPIGDPAWEAFTRTHPSGLFHTPAWLRAMRDTYGMSMRALCVPDGSNGGFRSALAFGFIDDLLGPRIRVLPFSDYCDPPVESAEDWDRLIDGILERHPEAPIVVRPLWNDIPRRDPRFESVKEAAWHGIDLSGGSEAVWARASDSFRRGVRKARREGVEVRRAPREDLRRFFEIHLNVRKRKYSLLAQPCSFFENLWFSFVERGYGFILGAYGGPTREMIAGVMYLASGDTLTYKFAASNPEFLGLRPNNILLWEGIRMACEGGFGSLDLGLSDLDQQGLLSFKRHVASAEGRITFLQHTPPGASPAHEGGVKALLGRMTGLLTAPGVPDAVTEDAGNALYRYFA